MKESKAMGPRLQQPLPIRDGLNPSRVKVTEPGWTAQAFIQHLIDTQRWQAPNDDVAQRFRAGEVRDDHGREVTPNEELPVGKDIWFYRTPAPETPVPYIIDHIYEDNNILVVNKPPFLATFPRAAHITETVLVRLRRQTGNNELSPAHRLDRLTSGVLLLTKRREVRGAYQMMFADRTPRKIYHAIAPHKPELNITPGTTWRSRLEKTHGELQTRVIPNAVPNAITEIQHIQPLPTTPNQQPLARYTLAPHTGKTHQLRVHMWQAGIPIIGDPVYPTLHPYTDSFDTPLALLAKELYFQDPLTGQPRHFTSPIEVDRLIRT